MSSLVQRRSIRGLTAYSLSSQSTVAAANELLYQQHTQPAKQGLLPTGKRRSCVPRPAHYTLCKK